MNMKQALTQFVYLKEGHEEAMLLLSSFPQSDTILVTLTQTDLCRILSDVINQKITIETLELWANVVEQRADIDCHCIEGAVFALANPDQMGSGFSLDREKVAQMLALLKLN